MKYSVSVIMVLATAIGLWSVGPPAKENSQSLGQHSREIKRIVKFKKLRQS